MKSRTNIKDNCFLIVVFILMISFTMNIYQAIENKKGEDAFMNELELSLKSLIIEKYGSLKKFSDTIDMPWTTLDSILKRGVANSNITNVLKITRELGLDAEKLVEGTICDNVHSQTTMAAHFDGDEYTEEQLNRIRQFAEFIKQDDAK